MAIGISELLNTVYYGPNSAIYPKAGKVGPQAKVSILWEENGWYYIEYESGRYKKRGYLPAHRINYIIGKVIVFPLKAKPRITKTSATTYFGPIPSIYAKAGSVIRYEPVIVFNVGLGGYLLAEYNISNDQKKRAFISSEAIYDELYSSLVAVVGTRLADFNDETAYGSGSLYQKEDLRGHCTWYCWGRAKEKCQQMLTFSYPNHVQHWLKNCTGGYQKLETDSVKPMKNAIACYKGGYAGHLAFIEDVENDFVYFTDANANGNNIVDKTDGILQIKTESEFRKHLNKTLQGYIVL